jgi:hypothetical protein
MNGGTKPNWYRRAALTLAGVLAVGTPAVFVLDASADTVSGATPWSILKCKASDNDVEPHDDAFYREMFTEDGWGMGGLADYFWDQSENRLRLYGSTVQGWYRLPFTEQEVHDLGRGAAINACVTAARANGYAVPSDHKTMAILNVPGNSGAYGDRVLLASRSQNLRFAAHEMLHSYGLDHSWSDDPFYDAKWADPGEYDDPWDIMSAQHSWAVDTRFGKSAVGMNGFNRDKLGWMSADSTLTFGVDGIGIATVTLNALESRERSHPRLVKVPFDTEDPNHYYTVEYRRKTSWSEGIPKDVVLIHEIKDGKSYLLRTHDEGERAPVSTVSNLAVYINVEGMDGETATVKISSIWPLICCNG